MGAIRKPRADDSQFAAVETHYPAIGPRELPLTLREPANRATEPAGQACTHGIRKIGRVKLRNC
jgi:hypothetical protein